MRPLLRINICSGHARNWQPYGQGPKLRPGSVVGCGIDLEAATISYWIDGKPLGVAFTNIPSKQISYSLSSSDISPQAKDTVFFPAVSLKGRKTSVKVCRV
jgi:hypothetical protein